MNNRNYFDLYEIHTKTGDDKKALYYFEKAARFAANKTDKITMLTDLCHLLWVNKDYKKFKYTLKEYNAIDVALEAIVLEYYNFPYEQSKKD